MENLGLVGFTGAGANRLFSALTGLAVPSEYEEAVGVASVPDERVHLLAEMSKSKKVVTAGFELAHLALPPGSKPGEGLGAKFIGTLRNCDAILIVLRASTTAGSARPIPKATSPRSSSSWCSPICTQRRAAAHSSAARRQERRQGDREPRSRSSTAPTRCWQKARRSAAPACRADDLERLAPVFLLTTKPLLIVANTGEDNDAGGALPDDALPVPIDIEAEIAACAPEDRAEMRESYGLGESALDTVAQARTTCSAGARSSRPARTSRARGRSARERRRPSVRA